MKRWNGWGEIKSTYPLPESAAQFIAAQVGAGKAVPDARLEDVLPRVPPSRLQSNPLILIDAEERLRHARGQSLPDWIALRSGAIPVFPDGVAYPNSEADVSELLSFASHTGASLIPYGGGSSVVGHINPLAGDAPVLTVDMSRMDHRLAFSPESLLATFEAGVRGPDLESNLAQDGFTLGHYPQSFEFSTLGGWVATRSSGQQSFHYGRIEDLFAGGRLQTPRGALDLPTVPASAAGPDLKQLVLGSEGRLGILTRATVRIRPLPARETFLAAFFPDWELGAKAVRVIVQADIPVSMLRLSNARETQVTLALSGRERLVGLAERGMPILGYGPTRCLLIYGLTGSPKPCRLARGMAEAAIRAYHGMLVPYVIGAMWRKTRFTTPYLRNTLWEKGYALDTLETALPWEKALPTACEMQAALTHSLDEVGERVLAFTHLSHVYRSGASFYVTYLFRRSQEPAETLNRWKAMKGMASQIIQRAGGTISHQHGVGTDHAGYLPQEKGFLGMQVLSAVCAELDPQGLMNPGKLIQPVQEAANGTGLQTGRGLVSPQPAL